MTRWVLVMTVRERDAGYTVVFNVRALRLDLRRRDRPGPGPDIGEEGGGLDGEVVRMEVWSKTKRSYEVAVVVSTTLYRQWGQCDIPGEVECGVRRDVLGSAGDGFALGGGGKEGV